MMMTMACLRRLLMWHLKKYNHQPMRAHEITEPRRTNLTGNFDWERVDLTGPNDWRSCYLWGVVHTWHLLAPHYLGIPSD